MLWSIIPQEIVFQRDDGLKRNYIQYKGRTVQTVTYADGREMITGLVSSDPQDYLNLDFAPGSYIKTNKN